MRYFKHFLFFSSIFLSSAYSFADITKQWHRQTLQTNAELRGSAAKDSSVWLTGSNNSVFISLDKGKSWHDRSLKSDTQYDFRDIHVFDRNTAIIMAAGSAHKSALFITYDQGVNWKMLLENKVKTGFYNAIAFWDRQNGLLMGDPINNQFMIKKTTDGGVTWQSVFTIENVRNNEAAFAASGHTLIIDDKKRAWFTSGGKQASIYRSLDNGLNWSRQIIPLYSQTTTAGGYSVAQNSLGTVYALGGDYKQRAGQYSNMAVFDNDKWQTVASGKRGLRTAMACIDAICITTGKLGSDISYDNGKQWQPFSSYGYYTLTKLDNRIIAAGSRGQIATVTF